LSNMENRLPGKRNFSMGINHADVAELVDARDLKSLDGNVVWVRVPPPAPGDAVGARVPPKRLSTQARAAVQVAIPRRHSIVPPHGGPDRGSLDHDGLDHDSLGLDSRRRNSAIIPAEPRAHILFGASYSLKLNHLPGTSRCFPFVGFCHGYVSFTRSSCSSIPRPMSPSVTSGLHSPRRIGDGCIVGSTNLRVRLALAANVRGEESILRTSIRH
jgi:hypothetical protein